jgi:formate dehydrogenase beta subunit
MGQVKQMNMVSFSSWNGKIIDNRKGAAKGAKAAPVPADLDGSKFKALIGWNGLIVSDPAADVPSLTLSYLKAARNISCGECSVCMIGIDKLIDIFRSMGAGKGSAKDLAEIEEIVKGVSANSKCNFGGSSLAPVLDAVKNYKADFIEVIGGKKKLADINASVEVDAPCVHSCPARLDIPGYIELIRNARFKDSLNLIRERCILPGVIGRACPAPCQSACVRKDIDEPVAIRLLKRAAADVDYQTGSTPIAGSCSGKDKVAVIGAGPAGLAAACQLRRIGYQVTVFEALPFAGGMAATGIPDYRLPKNVLNHEIDLVRAMGVEVKLGTPVEGLKIKDLKDKGYKAIFLAVGAQKGTKIGCKGEDEGYEGIVDGVEFLKDLSFGKKAKALGKVVIIGGGNVAIDCARTCKRLGFKEVEILYRRSRAEMPAHDEEIEAAEKEGVKFSYLAAPVALAAKGGKIAAIEAIRMKLGEPDESGRRRPVPVKGSEFMVPTAMVISATGQKPELGFTNEIETTSWGTIKVDPARLTTNIEGVFSGGDCVSGPATLIEALNAGNIVARSIDSYLQGKGFEKEIRFESFDPGQKREQIFVPAKAAEKVESLDPKTRIEGFSEVEGGFNAAEAIKEAKRCLRCYRLVVWQ